MRNALYLLLAMLTVDVRLGPKQRDIVTSITRPQFRFEDVEGAMRSAKTWSILLGIRQSLQEHPGMVWTMARWNKGDLDQKLIPDYRNVCQTAGQSFGTWNTLERCFDFDNGSRLYAIHGKAGSTENKYAHVRGLTTAGFFINQLEEWPEDVYNEAALRLSQPGYPQQMIVDPNPVHDSHWIAKRFPVNNHSPLHRYRSLSIWDNKLLSPETVSAAEILYPVGHPMRRVKLEGLRGLDVQGTPVYFGAFVRSRHVPTEGVALHSDLPLCESYDYGFHHPCVVWYQVAPWGWLRILGGVMGTDLHLDAFLPIVERYREQWFPQYDRLESTCDPAGAANNSQGLRGTPVGLLREWYRVNGNKDQAGQFVVPRYLPDANHPERRYAANQTVATYMRRRANGDEAFLVDPERWREVSATEDTYNTWFIDGLEAGYVLEEDSRHSSRLGTYTMPKKDGWFEHGQNCLEYAVQASVYDLPVGKEAEAKAIEVKTSARVAAERERREARLLRQEQQDHDPGDRPTGRNARDVGRRVMRRSPLRRA